MLTGTLFSVNFALAAYSCIDIDFDISDLQGEEVNHVSAARAPERQ